jgi:hypothetical protein
MKATIIGIALVLSATTCAGFAATAAPRRSAAISRIHAGEVIE